MRRWVFAFLLFVVPFQLVWGAAAPYCAHEATTETTARAGKHFGHHEHKHQGGGEITPASEEGIASAYHADCESCHLGCTVTPLAPAMTIGILPHGAVVADPAFTYRSHIPSGPERPDRSASTAAARFGGGVVFGSHPA
jgi:hypothetical protein